MRLEPRFPDSIHYVIFPQVANTVVVSRTSGYTFPSLPLLAQGPLLQSPLLPFHLHQPDSQPGELPLDDRWKLGDSIHSSETVDCWMLYPDQFPCSVKEDNGVVREFFHNWSWDLHYLDFSLLLAAFSFWLSNVTSISPQTAFGSSEMEVTWYKNYQ